MALKFIKRIKGAADEHHDNGGFLRSVNKAVFVVGGKIFSYQNDLSYFFSSNRPWCLKMKLLRTGAVYHFLESI